MEDIEIIIECVNEYETSTLAEFIQVAHANGVVLDAEMVSIAKDYIESIWKYAERYSLNFSGALRYINDEVKSDLSACKK